MDQWPSGRGVPAGTATKTAPVGHGLVDNSSTVSALTARRRDVPATRRRPTGRLPPKAADDDRLNTIEARLAALEEQQAATLAMVQEEHTAVMAALEKTNELLTVKLAEMDRQQERLGVCSTAPATDAVPARLPAPRGIPHRGIAVGTMTEIATSDPPHRGRLPKMPARCGGLIWTTRPAKEYSIPRRAFLCRSGHADGVCPPKSLGKMPTPRPGFEPRQGGLRIRSEGKKSDNGPRREDGT